MTYTINTNSQFNSLEISFNGIPSAEIRNALKALKFRWHAVKKVWYGFAKEEDIKNLLDGNSKKAPANNEWLEKAKAILNNNGQTFNGYLGAIGWKGSNISYDIVQINKELKLMMKALHPEVTLKAKAHKYSGGQSHTLTLALSADFIKTEEEYINSRLLDGFGLNRWVDIYDENGRRIGSELYENIMNNKEVLIRTIKHDYNYYLTNGFSVHSGWNNSMLNDKGQAIFKDLYTLNDSYNYDDSNGMVDYFDTNFYTNYCVEVKA